jgi:hypothetical protein
MPQSDAFLGKRRSGAHSRTRRLEKDASFCSAAVVVEATAVSAAPVVVGASVVSAASSSELRHAANSDTTRTTGTNRGRFRDPIVKPPGRRTDRHAGLLPRTAPPYQGTSTQTTPSIRFLQIAMLSSLDGVRMSMPLQPRPRQSACPEAQCPPAGICHGSQSAAPQEGEFLADRVQPATAPRSSLRRFRR